MDIRERQDKVEELNGREADVRARLEASPSDAERAELERYLRILGTLKWAHLSNIKEELNRAVSGRVNHQLVARQARA